MIKIIIADDHTIVRRGIKQILASTPDMAVVDEANDSRELFDKLKTNSIDLIILDISMPGRNGIEIIPTLRTNYPELPILILSMHPEEEFAVESIRRGASGYVTKDSAPEELITAVRKIHQGRKYVSPSLAEILASELDLDSIEKRPHEHLSDRELQVMKLIAKGRTLSDISKSLELSTKTISTYRANILKKMKMKSNADLTMYAVKSDLL